MLEQKLRVYYYPHNSPLATQFATTRGPGRKVMVFHDDPEKIKHPQTRVYVQWNYERLPFVRLH